MKRRNLILQSAVALALGAAAAGAQAGTIGTTTQTLATEVFGTGSDTVAVKPTGITYQFGVPVAANQTVYMYVQLSGGAKFTGANAADMTCVDAASATRTATAAVVSTDGTFAVFTVGTGPSGFSTNSVCNYAPAAANVNTLSAALGTAGGTVSATWTNAGSLSTTAVPTTGLVDAGGTHTGTILTSAQAITGSIVASSAFPVGGVGVAETQRIDVGATPAFTSFTTGANTGVTSIVNLGAITFTNVGGTQADATGADYTIAGKASGQNVTVTGDFSAAGTAGGVHIDTGADCATGPVGTGTLNSAKTQATFTGLGVPTSGTPRFVCFTLDNAPRTVAIATQTPTATSTLTKTAATDQTNVIAATNLYQLQTNGASVDVRSYVPAANAPAGYTSYVRVINTGTVATPITVAVINGTTGAVGTSGTLISSLPAGAAMTLTASQVEAVTGALAAADRPRLRISGATNGLQVQSFMSNPGGVVSDMTGAQ